MDRLPADWTVIHGRRFTLLRDRGHPDEGEIDFAVLEMERNPGE